jgi:F0F1-type ATP synthase delta subunit
MKRNKSAKQLSNVLFECADSANALEEVRDSIYRFDSLVRSNIELKSFIQGSETNYISSGFRDIYPSASFRHCVLS